MDNSKPIRIVIPGDPRTKKNHQRIFRNPRTGQQYVMPSAQYAAYEELAGWKIPKLGIEHKVNVRVLYFMSTKRRVDLVGLLQATDDILVKYGAIKDDSVKYIGSHDGSRVYYDKHDPRAEIYIEQFIERSTDNDDRTES
jgi:Holliday junction resolvase RusA-like endonuclease